MEEEVGFTLVEWVAVVVLWVTYMSVIGVICYLAVWTFP